MKNTMYDFSCFQFVEGCFVARYIVCPGGVPCALEKNECFAVVGLIVL